MEANWLLDLFCVCHKERTNSFYQYSREHRFCGISRKRHCYMVFQPTVYYETYDHIRSIRVIFFVIIIVFQSQKSEKQPSIVCYKIKTSYYFSQLQIGVCVHKINILTSLFSITKSQQQLLNFMILIYINHQLVTSLTSQVLINKTDHA